VSGNVTLASTAGYTPIHSPTGVSLGDVIRVGAGDSAVLSFGARCQLTLTGPERLRVRRVGACACAAFLPAPTAASGAGPGGAIALSLLALGGGTAILVGAANSSSAASP